MAVTRTTDRALYIEIPADLKRRLQHEAVERDITMRDILIEALTAHFATQPLEAIRLSVDQAAPGKARRRREKPAEEAPTPIAGRGARAGRLARWWGRVVAMPARIER